VSLRGLTILSLEQATTLPYLTYRLACNGARVIRIESPTRPDPNRFVGRPVMPETGMDSYFLPNNCGKEAITLNLAEAEGRRILGDLLIGLRVDVFACNQRPRTYARLGIDYERLRTVKPDLIWVGVSGFGPDHDEAAYDPILQARAGFMELTGAADGPPTVFGLPMVDLGAGEHGYGEIMKALYLRALDGKGRQVDLSMFRSAVSWMLTPVMLTASLGEPVGRRGNTHQFFAPVSVYATRDGYVYMAVGNDRQWAALTALPPFAGLSEARYAANAGRIAEVTTLNRILGERFAALDTVPAITLLHGAGIPASRVSTIAELLADPLVVPGLVRVTDPRSGLTVLLPPPPAGAPAALSFPPRLGEHNDRIYAEALGYGPGQIRALADAGII
jgi:crotonobetainyl-CoA:carnitine CoA-transferase CaiB-like acyl-CoA transferase